MEHKTVYVDRDGVKRTMLSDEGNPDVVRINTEVDMTSTVENNRVMRELHPQHSTNKLVARGIPMTVYEKSIIEDWDEKDWAKWLNDPDNRAFRVWEGHV